VTTTELSGGASPRWSSGVTAPRARGTLGAVVRLPCHTAGVQTAGMRHITILGSTGSIGTQAIDVIMRHPEDFRVVALAAGGGRPDLLAEQAARLGVDAVGVADPAASDSVMAALRALDVSPQVLVGADAATEIAAWPADTVLNGMDGAAGLGPTLAALGAGHRLALANKESLIIGGPLVAAATAPGQIVPVDSEPSALAQCLRGERADEVRRLVLTASGGPFRGRARGDLVGVTPSEALDHPTWDMGPLVTVNSATLVNKGLEVIEAHLLFHVPLDRIDVVVHPQSVVHSMVEFVDGSTIAQASPPDMRLPISWGLGWPDRVSDAAPGLDWTTATTWEFMPLDTDAFPAVDLARLAGAAGGTAPAVFNAVNEVSVEAFLHGRAGFLAIVDTIADVLGEHLADGTPDGGSKSEPSSLTVDDVMNADQWGRRRAGELLAARSPAGDAPQGRRT
jgi:1-deoxy-D-xylulose-5-phosphate reductoisomerase